MPVVATLSAAAVILLASAAVYLLSDWQTIREAGLALFLVSLVVFLIGAAIFSISFYLPKQQRIPAEGTVPGLRGWWQNVAATRPLPAGMVISGGVLMIIGSLVYEFMR
jgi:hypothetical protein